MAQKKVTYKELQAELDMILDAMQRDELDIDEAMKAYERGMEILTELQAYVDKAQHTVTKLQKKFEAK